ncbi:hypothetical protein KIF53_00305 [Chromobacterium subtsugae]|uniref:Uncharacterized protein n=1 Tax=Chromobacterium subtsugae TaxID=251747 RepID=A0ABS7F9T1_9NEIS|nr:MULTISPECIES: hypothetical protein [Chromobacterium]KUM02203.1 hypothetical protein Cv017_04295 [Chromobacterium subtsugae]KZE83144.1 hypothetical protein AWB61_05885 [Chromobacterium sp. F49]MBW7567104.1 hypothetical protein [Chromobacterium subtsugae]MBW8286074.1 hypothetical protein [Chromobacterium subtsugae]OBU86336.1 hypothetical protein MY55_11825 [Chromobacterium subtsugae]
MEWLNRESLLGLMEDVEAEDPIDYADLPFDERNLRELIVDSLLERELVFRAEEPDASRRMLVYLAATARLTLENMVLHARLLRAGRAED